MNYFFGSKICIRFEYIFGKYYKCPYFINSSIFQSSALGYFRVYLLHKYRVFFPKDGGDLFSIFTVSNELFLYLTLLLIVQINQKGIVFHNFINSTMDGVVFSIIHVTCLKNCLPTTHYFEIARIRVIFYCY